MPERSSSAEMEFHSSLKSIQVWSNHKVTWSVLSKGSLLVKTFRFLCQPAQLLWDACPEHVQLLPSDVCCILELSVTFLELFFPGISGAYYAPSYLNWKRLSWFLTCYFQKVAGKTEKAASRHECRRTTKRRKGKKHYREIYSGKGVKSRFQVPVFFDLFNLSNLSQLVIKGTVPLLSTLRLHVIPFAWKHTGPQVLTLTIFVLLQKGLYQPKRKGWKAPFFTLQIP